MTRSPGRNSPDDQGAGQRVLDESLDGPLERPRPVGGVGALAHDERLRGRRQLEDDVLLGQAPGQVGEQQVDDRAEVRLGQGVEHDDLVDAVEELRAGTAMRRASVTSRFICS